MKANVGVVDGLDNLFDWAIFLAGFAKAATIIRAMFANMNSFAVAVDNFPRFGTKFVAATNAQAESPNIEDFVVVEMIFAD
ncbi:MAG: hypothetical protein IJQ82_12045 [Selenomonadaceae bacterium]|nr:hypothetical protein [Selenomonadaceae bacterium]